MNAQPQIMAILNLTPDSFYDGGSYHSVNEVLKKAEQYVIEGAHILDLGAYSSRPGAEHISPEEEKHRLLPVLKEIRKKFPDVQISVDTFRSEIAKMAIEEGTDIINDISGGAMDEQMYKVIAHYQVPYILMHMRGTPQTMQQEVKQGTITEDVKSYFQKKLELLQNINVNNVILDVGFGFGKTLEQNYELLRNLNQFQKFGKPLLVGLSRKSMLYKLLQITPSETLNATSVAHTLALLNGADILRVHDVKAAVEVIEVVKQYFPKP